MCGPLNIEMFTSEHLQYEPHDPEFKWANPTKELKDTKKQLRELKENKCLCNVQNLLGYKLNDKMNEENSFVIEK